MSAQWYVVNGPCKKGLLEAFRVSAGGSRQAELTVIAVGSIRPKRKTASLSLQSIVIEDSNQACCLRGELECESSVAEVVGYYDFVKREGYLTTNIV